LIGPDRPRYGGDAGLSAKPSPHGKELVGLHLHGNGDLADRLGAAVYLAGPGPSGCSMYLGEAVSDILGFTPEELRADPGIWLRQLHPQDRDLVPRASSLATTGRVRSEYRLFHRDGRIVWVLDDAVLAHGQDGEQLLHGILLDVTDRKRTELMLSAQGDIVEAVAGGATLTEVLTLVAQAVESLIGSGECIVEAVAAVEAGRQLVMSADGPVADPAHWDPHAVVRSSPIRAGSGETLGRVVLRYRRGTTPPPAEEELPAWAARLAALALVRAAEHDRMVSSVALLGATLESTVDGILVVDRSGRIAGYNQTFADMWRIDPELISYGEDGKLVAYVLEQLVDPAGFLAKIDQLYDDLEQTSVDELAFLDGRVFERYSQPQRVDGTPVGRVWSFRDVTEKRRLQVDLRDSQDNLGMLVGQVRDYAILNLDPTGHVITWNAGAERIKGYTEQEILGQHFSVFYTEEDVAAGKPAHWLEIALAEGHALDEGWRVRKDGSLFWGTAVITALYDDDGRLRGFGKVTRDTTDKHDAELALQSQTRTLELLGAVASASNSAAGVEEALTATLKAFSEFGSWQLAHAYLADHDDPSALRHSVWHEETPGSFAGLRAATEATSPAADSLPRSAFTSPVPVCLPSLEGDPRFGRTTQAGLVAACAFPILVRDEPVGVLEFFSTQPRDCRADIRPVMQQIGAQLGRVVERERAELRLARHATQLERLSNRLETVLNSAGEGIYGLDAHGTVTFINDAGARLVGLPGEQMVGRAAQDVIHAESESGHLEHGEAPSSDALSTTATPRVLTGRHRRTDGSLFDSESVSAPILQDGAVVGSVVVFRDVSERRAVERLKDQFISMVSHELRTPLTGVRGALGLLSGGAAGPLPPKAARMVEVGTTSVDRLIRLITDILDFERMTAGRMTAHPRIAAAGPLITATVEEIAVLAAAAQVSVKAGNTPGAVLADPDRVLQILTNLIGNAVKFSDPGSTVELSTTVLEEHVRFDVVDDGPGIPPDQLDEIFQPFRQVDASDSRRHEGTGLGLAICRSIVEQHKGRIWASSEPGVGATFSFTLPRADQPSDGENADLRMDGESSSVRRSG